ncbi:MAG: ASCH domain-containing protein [Candidatus Hydrogenedentota bacterium]
MKCLSIRQPWAELLARGIKDVENRSWSTDYRGPLLIHAGQKIDEKALVQFAQRGIRFRLATGAIIGAATLIDCTAERRSDWHQEGKIGWYVADAKLFEAPIPLAGKLRLFDADDVLVASHPIP